MRVGITGSAGLLGWHFRAFLLSKGHTEVSCANRETFTSPQKLQEFTKECDVIVHFAAKIRGEPSDLISVNMDIAKHLIDACKQSKIKPHFIFASSIQALGDNPLGLPKKLCTEYFQTQMNEIGGKFTNLILPHVFGEFGKPFHNSVVSTFCFQLSNDESPKVIQDSKLNLLHAQRVADIIYEIIQEGRSGQENIGGTEISVTELLTKLKEIKSQYEKHIIPPLHKDLDLDLFSTYRNFLYPNKFPMTPLLRTDPRGSLFEVIKTHHGGQAFLSTTKPGITRGNHFHRRKFERFCVIKGKASIKMRRLFDDKILEFFVSGEMPQFVDIPTLYTHDITNTGTSELLTLFWTNEIFDPHNPDTITEKV